MAARANAADAIVVTGLGAVSALGHSAGEMWTRLCAGERGIGPLETPGALAFERPDGEPTTYPSIAAQVRGFDPRARIRSKHRRRMDRLSAMIVSAARDALDDAGVDTDAASEHERARLGIAVGSAFGNLRDSMTHIERMFGRGARSVSPMMFPNLVLNAPASYVAMELGATGANLTVSQLELSGEQAILTAHDLLRAGRADVVVAGGGDELAPIAVDVHRRARALSGQRGGPEWASPYDRSRNGIVLGEAAGMLVLETREHARRRGARIYAELTSTASGAMVAPPYAWPTAHAAAASPAPPAAASASTPQLDVDLVCGSASSTATLDAVELRWIESLLRTRDDARTRPWLTSIKGAVGELGAAGALTTIAAVLALDTQRVPPLAALVDGEPCEAVRYAPCAAVDSPLRRALVVGMARGGAYAHLLLEANE